MCSVQAAIDPGSRELRMMAHTRIVPARGKGSEAAEALRQAAGPGNASESEFSVAIPSVSWLYLKDPVGQPEVSTASRYTKPFASSEDFPAWCRVVADVV